MEISQLDRAKNRCQDCFALIKRVGGNWFCDAGFCPIEEIKLCHEFEGDRGDINNPEWAKINTEAN